MSTLILSCSTGQGHDSCGRAIQEYYKLQGIPCAFEDALSFVNPSFAHFISWGHTTIYRHFHSLFQVGYGYSEKHSLFQPTSPSYHLLAKGADRLYEYITHGCFDTVICSHVFGSLIVTEMQKKYHLPIVTGLVATDYTCNPGTKESTVDLYFIPDAPLAPAFQCPDIQDHQLVNSGIPIRQMFYHQTDKASAKRAFGVPVSHHHMLMMCGSMGCGPMNQLAELLSQGLPQNSDLSIVCGTNHALCEKLQRKYGSVQNIHILGYVEDVSMLMDSADLYLTKPGGISVTEAYMKNLPMVFINAVAGCEDHNRKYFLDKNAAVTASSVKELSDICLGLLKDPDRLESMHQNLVNCPKFNAAKVVYDSMTQLREAAKSTL